MGRGKDNGRTLFELKRGKYKEEEKKMARPYLSGPLYLKQGTSGDIIRHNVGFPGGGVETGAKIPEHLNSDNADNLFPKSFTDH